MHKTLSRSAAAIAAASLALAMAACSTPAGSGGDGEVQNISLAYSVEALDETQTNIAAQIQRRAAEITEEGKYKVTVTVFSADDSVDRQNADIETIVTRQTDGLIVTCVDPAGCVAALEAAHAAGVKIVDVRGNLPSEDLDVIYKGLDEPRMGQLLYERAVQYLDENPDAVLKFGLMMGGQTFTTTHARVEMIRKLAEEQPDRVQILVEDYGDWRTEKATSLMEDWAVRYPDMNALAVSSDEMTLGAVNVLRSQNKLSDFYILSVNGSDNGINMVRDGDIAATVGIDFTIYGMGMVDAAVASVLGEVGMGEVFDVSGEALTLVDKDNVDAFAEKKKADEAAAAKFNK